MSRRVLNRTHEGNRTQLFCHANATRVALHGYPHPQMSTPCKRPIAIDCHRLPSSNLLQKTRNFLSSFASPKALRKAMSKMVFKVPRLLPLLILFHSLCLTSLALRRGPETEVLRCLDDCDDEDVQEYITCHKECELRYREREERREEEERPGSREIDPRWQRRRRWHRGGGGGGGEREPEGPRGEREPAWGPGGEYDQCRRLCEPYKPQERERCWEQCEERERARERRRDREREREVNDGVRNPSRSERYERCERACKRQAGGQQRQLCKFRCRQQTEREERETPGGRDAKLLLGIICCAN